MKKHFLFLLLINSIISKAQVSDKIDGKWLVNLSLPDIGVVTTVLEIETEGNTFYAYSRKDADKLLLGNAKAPLIRKMSNFKNGSLIRVEKGELTKVLDTIKLKGVLVSSMGNYNFIGYILKDSIDINLSKRNLVTYGRVVGNRKDIKLPLMDYQKLFTSAMEITKERIYKKSLLDENKWKKFVSSMNDILPEIQDDLEMVSAFYYFGEKLSISHFAFLKSIENISEVIEKRKYATLEEKTPLTAYLKITSFDGLSKEIDSTFNLISQKNYKNLIVDLRNNQGGTVEAGMALANNIFTEPTNGGVFLTQKWFNKRETLPSLEEYTQFDNFSQSNYDQIINGIHNKEGLVLKVIPNKKPFKGNLFVLINKATASTCEPLIYELKKQKRAVLVGEKSAGAMLNGEKFKLYDNYFMYIPTADYYTSDGYRIEQNGVIPNVETKSEEALDKVLKELIKE
jgi:Peptidase family S41